MSRLPAPTMGGNPRPPPTRRCVSLLDDPKEAQHVLKSAQNEASRAPTNHVTTTPLCPITIHIDECGSNSSDNSDNDNDDNNETESKDRSQENYHHHNRSSSFVVGKMTHHGLSPPHPPHLPHPNNPQHRAFQNVYSTLGCKTSPSHSHRGSLTLLDVPENSELSTLKATAVRLNLRTRTSSFMEWQEKWLDNSRAPPQFPLPAEEGSGSGSGGGGNGGGGGGGGGRGVADRLTSERKERIGQALDWLKTELKEMRSMDQHLARQLLSLRHDIHQLRLRRSCQEHRDLLDDVQSELEEQVEMSDVLDLPNDLTLNDTPLKQIGVTRMNISRRRFSMC